VSLRMAQISILTSPRRFKASWRSVTTSSPSTPNVGNVFCCCCAQVSISPTFYEQLLRTSVALVAFLCLHFRFVLHCHKPTGAKAARRTLMKLSPSEPILDGNCIKFHTGPKKCRFINCHNIIVMRDKGLSNSVPRVNTKQMI
jgi:hypothetical protein